MAEGPVPEYLSLNKVLAECTVNEDSVDGVDLKELEEFIERCESYRRLQLQDQAARDARRPPEQLEALLTARAQLDDLEELRDIILRDMKRFVRKYTDRDLVKKIISMGPYGNDPEVLNIFETDENGKMSFENMKMASDMLGPYAFYIDRAPPGVDLGVQTHEQLFTCLPEIINVAYNAIFEIERSNDAA